MSRDNIVSIAERLAEPPPIDVLKPDWDACRHEHTVIDEKLRTVACADCREERLDPVEVLIMLARQWRRWQYEAERVGKVNADYRRIQREKWDRRRDRHLAAHPDHRRQFRDVEDVLAPRAYVDSRDAGLLGVTMPPYDECRECYHLTVQFQSGWLPRAKPEPPPGPLQAPSTPMTALDGETP